MKGLLICLLAGIVFPGMLSAAEDKRPVMAIIDFYPFGYRDADGEAVGMFFDMADAISADSGVDFDLKFLPVPRALRAAERGSVDMLISYKDEEMVKNVSFVGNVGCLTAYLVPGRDSGIYTLADIAGRRIAEIGGGYFQKRFSARMDFEHVVVPSNESMLRMISRGRVDGFVINDAVFDGYFSGHFSRPLPKNWRRVIADPIAIETLETHVSINRKSAYFDLGEALRKSIDHLRRGGEMAKIFARYGSTRQGRCPS